MKSLLKLVVLALAAKAVAVAACFPNPLGTFDQVVCVTASASGAATWGSITGTLSSQTDLQTALDAKVTYTRSTSDPSGGCTLGGCLHFNTATDTFWTNVDGTWSRQGKYSQGAGAPSAGACTVNYFGMLYGDTSVTTAANSLYYCAKTGVSTYAWTLFGSGSGSGGDVTAAIAFGTDNRLIRSDGTGKGVQSSGITVDDSNNVSGIANLTASGTITATTAGAGFEGTPIANASVTSPATAGDWRVFFDATNTDILSQKKSDSTLWRYVRNGETLAVDLSAAASTKPNKAGTSLPATCGQGETYIKTDATATNQLYVCTATNTWTAQGGAGGGGGTTTWRTMLVNRSYIGGGQTEAPLVQTNMAHILSGSDAAGGFAGLQSPEATDKTLTWNTFVPDGYTSGTLTLGITFWASSATGNIRFQVQTLCGYGVAPTGSGSSPSYNTASFVTVAGNTSLTETTVATIAVTGCAAGRPLSINVTRLRGDTLDTSTADVYLHSLKAVL